MAQHVICRSLSSGRGGGGGGGAAKAARGRHFIRDGGGGRPPQGYAGSGAGNAQLVRINITLDWTSASIFKHLYQLSSNTVQ